MISAITNLLAANFQMKINIPSEQTNPMPRSSVEQFFTSTSNLGQGRSIPTTLKSTNLSGGMGSRNQDFLLPEDDLTMNNNNDSHNEIYFISDLVSNFNNSSNDAQELNQFALQNKSIPKNLQAIQKRSKGVQMRAVCRKVVFYYFQAIKGKSPQRESVISRHNMRYRTIKTGPKSKIYTTHKRMTGFKFVCQSWRYRYVVMKRGHGLKTKARHRRRERALKFNKAFLPLVVCTKSSKFTNGATKIRSLFEDIYGQPVSRFQAIANLNKNNSNSSPEHDCALEDKNHKRKKTNQKKGKCTGQKQKDKQFVLKGCYEKQTQGICLPQNDEPDLDVGKINIPHTDIKSTSEKKTKDKTNISLNDDIGFYENGLSNSFCDSIDDDGCSFKAWDLAYNHMDGRKEHGNKKHLLDGIQRVSSAFYPDYYDDCSLSDETDHKDATKKDSMEENADSKATAKSNRTRGRLNKLSSFLKRPFTLRKRATSQNISPCQSRQTFNPTQWISRTYVADAEPMRRRINLPSKSYHSKETIAKKANKEADKRIRANMRATREVNSKNASGAHRRIDYERFSEHNIRKYSSQLNTDSRERSGRTDKDLLVNLSKYQNFGMTPPHKLCGNLQACHKTDDAFGQEAKPCPTRITNLHKVKDNLDESNNKEAFSASGANWYSKEPEFQAGIGTNRLKDSKRRHQSNWWLGKLFHRRNGNQTMSANEEGILKSSKSSGVGGLLDHEENPDGIHKYEEETMGFRASCGNKNATRDQEKSNVQKIFPVVESCNVKSFLLRNNANNNKGWKQLWDDCGEALSFADEFRALETLKKRMLSSMTFQTATKNLHLNKYQALLPPDHSLVTVETPFQSQGDYYNASLIPTSIANCNFSYIAAQSPFSPQTVDNFWRLIVYNRIESIVMMSSSYEDGAFKSMQYWNETGVFAEGPVLARVSHREEFADFMVRKFEVSAPCTLDLTVWHFQYMTWPKKRVPFDPSAILELRCQMRCHHGNKESPVLVHCSTGVARTGVFIAVDALIEDYWRTGVLNVFEFVKYLRRYRPHLVRSFSQYKFVYECLWEEFHAGDTLLKGPSLTDNFRALACIHEQTGNSCLRDQFITLCSCTRKPQASVCREGMKPENECKNRNQDILPPDMYRPQLNVSNDPNASNNYINAIFVNGARRNGEFIVTQNPLPYTTFDFWRLVYDHQIQTIVSLTSCMNADSPMFWPMMGSRQFAYFTVELVNATTERDITVRNLKLWTPTPLGLDKRAVRQFQMSQWDDGSFHPMTAPTGQGQRTHGVIDLMEMVLEWQTIANGRAHPMVVHDQDGATWSGFFCASVITCERFAHDCSVDVYHIVKSLKKRRCQFLAGFDQYRLLHRVLWDYQSHLKCKLNKEQLATDSSKTCALEESTGNEETNAVEKDGESAATTDSTSQHGSDGDVECSCSCHADDDGDDKNIDIANGAPSMVDDLLLDIFAQTDSSSCECSERKSNNTKRRGISVMVTEESDSSLDAKQRGNSFVTEICMSARDVPSASDDSLDNDDNKRRSKDGGARPKEYRSAAQSFALSSKPRRRLPMPCADINKGRHSLKLKDNTPVKRCNSQRTSTDGDSSVSIDDNYCFNDDDFSNESDDITLTVKACEDSGDSTTSSGGCSIDIKCRT